MNGIIRAKLEHHEIDTNLSAELVKEVIEEIAAQHGGGQTVYLKNLCAEKATELSRKYRKTQAWIRKMITKAAEDVTE
ncbi:MAG: hypothetical protein PHR16_11355 [Methylovulum sp.]|nr:hypothetical protein [Methylovulum sp.]